MLKKRLIIVAPPRRPTVASDKCISIFARAQEPRLFEEPLSKQVQVIAPLGRVVAVGVDMPDVRHVVLLEVGVNALADADQAVLVAAGQPQELQLLACGRGIGDELGGRLVLGAEEKPPTQANVSRWARPKLSDWPPPIERPARARCSRSAITE